MWRKRGFGLCPGKLRFEDGEGVQCQPKGAAHLTWLISHMLWMSFELPFFANSTKLFYILTL